MNSRLVFFFCGLIGLSIQAAEPVSISSLPGGVRRVEIFLLAGQSNMKGRGAIPVTQPETDRVLFMSMADDKWYPAHHPLHKAGVPDLIDGKDNAGVGPGIDFASALLGKRDDVLIALVPCAKGGAWIDLWMPRQRFYGPTIQRIKKALDDFPEGTARIAGILWLQGESDAVENRYEVYQEKLDRMVAAFREDLGVADLPFVACTIGSFIKPRGKYFYVNEINEALLGLPGRVRNSACVDARDLSGHIGDFMHYNTGSQQEIGSRMAEAYLSLK